MSRLRCMAEVVQDDYMTRNLCELMKHHLDLDSEYRSAIEAALHGLRGRKDGDMV